MTDRPDARRGLGSHNPIGCETDAAYSGVQQRRDDPDGGWRDSSAGGGSGWPVALTSCRTCCCESPCCRSVEECCRFPPPFFCFMFPHLSRTFPVADAPCDCASDRELPACDWESESTWKGCDVDSADLGARGNGRRSGGKGTDGAIGTAGFRKLAPILEHRARLRRSNRGYHETPHFPPSWNSASTPADLEVQRRVSASGGAREAQFLFALELFQSDSRERINNPMVGLISRDAMEHDATFATAGDAAFERGWSEEVWRHDPILSCCVSAVHCLTRLLHATLVSSNVLLSKSLTPAWSSRKRSKEQAERSGGWRWRKAARQAGEGKYCCAGRQG
ncbi:hypothetical protein CLOP_g23001 [Closterium sp. NIES-67]|nr:hypothetical protein CLOP_g23001 [Closterium sp. NIES-67]